MFEQVLSSSAKKTLALLSQSQLLAKSYLAGGTALALQLGHRYSYDFDFFSRKPFEANLVTKKIIQQLHNFRLKEKTASTILGQLGKTKFSLFLYQYPLLYKTHRFLEIEIADVGDIAPMKIAAIADRGTKRDFIDLYFILSEKRLPNLEAAFKLYDRKFKALAQNKIHLLKSLVYFEDAEKDEIPRMLKPTDWSLVKKFFNQEQKKLVKKLIGI